MPDLPSINDMNDALDGNAASGMLSDVFAAEMTAAVTVCGTCGDSRALGELRAYLQAPGAVLRCATCAAVQVRMVRGPDRAWLDLRGVQTLQIDIPNLPDPSVAGGR